MDRHKISRRTLLTVAAAAVGTAALPPSNALEAQMFPDSGKKADGMGPDVYANLFGVFNVKNYGAKGDGIADDAAAIAAVIAAVPRQGGIVYFPPGIYLLNSSIVVNGRTNLTLLGAGVSAARLQMNANGVSTSVTYLIKPAATRSGRLHIGRSFKTRYAASTTRKATMMSL